MSSFDTPNPITLAIELDAGEVLIDATTTTVTEIELRPLRAGDQDAISLIKRARIKHGGDTVVVQMPRGSSGQSRRSPEIALAVRLPIGSTVSAKLRSADLRVTGEVEQVRLDTASGDATFADVAGSAVLGAASGDITLGTVGGSLRVKTASGNVGIETCCGDCSVQTASGDVSLGVVEGDLGAKTASGDIVVRAADASVRARTASGDVQLQQVRTGRVEVDTVSGEVEIGVERGISVHLDVSSLSGGVDSSLEPSDAPIDGGKTLDLRVRTVSGDIQLQPV